MKATADNLAAANHECTNGRGWARTPDPSACEAQRFPHVALVVANDHRRHRFVFFFLDFLLPAWRAVIRSSSSRMNSPTSLNDRYTDAKRTYATWSSSCRWRITAS